MPFCAFQSFLFHDARKFGLYSEIFMKYTPAFLIRIDTLFDFIINLALKTTFVILMIKINEINLHRLELHRLEIQRCVVVLLAHSGRTPVALYTI